MLAHNVLAQVTALGRPETTVRAHESRLLLALVAPVIVQRVPGLVDATAARRPAHVWRPVVPQRVGFVIGLLLIVNRIVGHEIVRHDIGSKEHFRLVVRQYHAKRRLIERAQR